MPMPYEYAPGLPIRQNLILPDGQVRRVPINPQAPDAWTIIGAIETVIDTFGRDPAIRAFAVSLLNSRLDNDVARHVRRITDWVKSHMVYLADPDGSEYIQTPTILLQQIQLKGVAYGDCDDHVVLLGALLRAIGVPAHPVAVKLNPQSPVFDHVVIEYPSQGEMVIIDPCAKNVAAPHYFERLRVA